MMQSMRTVVRKLLPLGVCGLALVGCLGGGGGSDGGGNPSGSGTSDSNTLAGNNRALLQGAVIGTSTEAVGNLRKQIAVTVIGKNDSFSVGTAVATRSSSTLPGAGYTYIIVPVTNIGKESLCLIQLTGLTYRDAAGVALVTPNPYKTIFVTGSVGKLSSGAFTDTCLAPSETGFAIEVTPGLYTKVVKVEFTLTSVNTGVASPSARVIPESYTTGAIGSLVINVANKGQSPALVSRVTWFLLDDLGEPLFFGLTNQVTGTFPVSGTRSISTYATYNGSGSRLLVFMNFMDGVVTAVLRDAGDAPPLDECGAALQSDERMSCELESRSRWLQLLTALEQATVQEVME